MDRRSGEDAVLRREAGRALVVDEHGRILLLHGRDDTRPEVAWWFTPGGGCDPGECHRDAARRELREETGLETTDLRGPVAVRTISFTMHGLDVVQHELYFVARVDGFDPLTPELHTDRAGWTEIEQRTVLGLRWWTPEELNATTATIYPGDLVALLAKVR